MVFGETERSIKKILRVFELNDLWRKTNSTCPECGAQRTWVASATFPVMEAHCTPGCRLHMKTDGELSGFDVIGTCPECGDGVLRTGDGKLWCSLGCPRDGTDAHPEEPKKPRTRVGAITID